MNHPQQNNRPQSIAEKAEFLNNLREMIEITKKIMDKTESGVKKLYGINGNTVAVKLELWVDHMALREHIGEEHFLPIETPGGKKAVLIVKPKSTGSMGGAQSYDVSIEWFLCQNPKNNQQVYVIRYDSGASMLTIQEGSSNALLGSITLHEYDDNFDTNSIMGNEKNLDFKYGEKWGRVQGGASYKLQRSNIKFTFRSQEDFENIQSAMNTTRDNMFTNNIKGSTSADLASLFN